MTPEEEKELKGHINAISRSKVYAQYWYHYEYWENGRCVEKKSKYIPKRVRSRVSRMNNEKVPVNEILKVLTSRSKTKKR